MDIKNEEVKSKSRFIVVVKRVNPCWFLLGIINMIAAVALLILPIVIATKILKYDTIGLMGLILGPEFFVFIIICVLFGVYINIYFISLYISIIKRKNARCPDHLSKIAKTLRYICEAALCVSIIMGVVQLISSENEFSGPIARTAFRLLLWSVILKLYYMVLRMVGMTLLNLIKRIVYQSGDVQPTQDEESNSEEVEETAI